MTRWKWPIGIAAIVFTIIGGVVSFDYVNRRFPAKPAPAEQVIKQDAKQPVHPAPVEPSSACVERDGSWRHWSWPNVPMLSPKCESAK